MTSPHNTPVDQYNQDEHRKSVNDDSFLKGFIAQKECTACSRTSYKIVPLTSLSKYLHYGTSESEVNINNGSEKLLKNVL
jgi:hypothetical protein